MFFGQLLAYYNKVKAGDPLRAPPAPHPPLRYRDFPPSLVQLLQIDSQRLTVGMSTPLSMHFVANRCRKSWCVIRAMPTNLAARSIAF